MTDPRADPGWKVDAKVGLKATLSPKLAMSGTGSTLAKLRSILLTFTIEVLVFGVVLALLDLDVEDGLNPGASVAIVAALGVCSLVVAPLLRRLDPSSERSLRSSYRQRFLVRLAVAEGVELVGFVLAFLTGSIVTYLVALPFTLMGFARAAPTSASIDREDQELRATGCPYPLHETLLG